MGIIRSDLVRVMYNSIAGLGFSPEMAKAEVPAALFLPESDLAPVAKCLDDVVAGLTRWQPQVKAKTLIKPPAIRVEGKSYEEALGAANTLFLKNLWGDGLPLLPPTQERVQWILRGTDLSRETVIGKIMPAGRIATVEGLAVALAMAGGRPEYLPVLIAAVQALIDKNTNHQSWQATSGSVFPAVIINGSVARQIRLNSGWGLMGPDSQHPAGAAIGRALRLLMQNIGGAIPGVGTLAQYAGMRYTNAVFAEDEEAIPQGWKPLNAEYFDLREGSNSVALMAVGSSVNINSHGNADLSLEAQATQMLFRYSHYMALPNVNMMNGYFDGTPGILILSSVLAKEFADTGWTKEKIKEFFFKNARIPLGHLRSDGFDSYLKTDKLAPTLKEDPWPITAKASNFMIVVAGGRHPTHAYWMQAMGGKPVSAEIRLPAKWRELLAEAEQELGPIP